MSFFKGDATVTGGSAELTENNTTNSHALEVTGTTLLSGNTTIDGSTITLLNNGTTTITKSADGADTLTIEVTGNTAGVLDFNSSGSITVDGVGISIDGTGASNLSVTGANLTLSTITTGLVIIDGAGNVEVNSSGGTINLGNDAVNQPINLATGGTRTLTVGAGSTTTLDINAGTVTLDGTGISIDGTSASNLSVTGADLTLSTITTGLVIIDGAGNVEVNSSGGTINLGNDAVSQPINLATGGTRTLTIGAGSTTTLDINAGTVTLDGTGISIDGSNSDSNFTVTGTTADPRTLTLKTDNSSTGNSIVTISATSTGGTGTINITPDDTLTMSTVLVDVNATGAVTINSAAASHFSVAGANLTLETTSSGAVDVNSAGAVTIDSAAASHFTVAGADLTLSTTTSGNIQLSSAGVINANGSRIVSVGTPTAVTDAANKAYVDSTSQGLDVKDQVSASSTAHLAGKYKNGTENVNGTNPGVGAILKAYANGSINTFDGVTLAVSDRILIKNQNEPEVTLVVTDGQTFLQGQYFDIYSPVSGGFRLWLDTANDDTTGQPASGGLTLYSLNASGGVTPENVAAAIQTELGYGYADVALTGIAEEFGVIRNQVIITNTDQTTSVTTHVAVGTTDILSTVITAGVAATSFAKTAVRVHHDINGSFNNTYFLVTDGDAGSTQYHIWFNVGSTGIDPSPGSSTGIEVAISADDTAVTIANAIVTAINTNGNLSATNDAVTIMNTVGGTVTNASGNGGFAATNHIQTIVDGVTTSTSSIQNGIYTVTAVGDGSNPWVLTRSTDLDGSPISEIDGGEYVFTNNGTTNAKSSFVLEPVGVYQHNDVGYTSFKWNTFSVTGTYSAGNGLTLTGTSFSVNLGYSGFTWTQQHTFDAGLKLNDSDAITLGTGNDITVAFNGTNLVTTSSAGVDQIIKLGSTDGTDSLLLTDSADATVFSVDSDGNTSISGTLTVTGKIATSSIGTHSNPTAGAAGSVVSSATYVFITTTLASSIDLADGTTNGEEKIIFGQSLSGTLTINVGTTSTLNTTSTLTNNVYAPTGQLGSSSTITMDTTGQNVRLVWYGAASAWFLVGGGGATVTSA